MKLIEAMKRVKQNKEKITDLQSKIRDNCAHYQHETPLYGDEQGNKVKEWLQSCNDLAQENCRLLLNIQHTNLATQVTIGLGEKSVTKPIAWWVWRRREYAAMDLKTWQALSDRGLKEGHAQSTTGQPFEMKLKRHYDPAQRDEKVAMYKAEPHEIDAALEIANAITDLIEK